MRIKQCSPPSKQGAFTSYPLSPMHTPNIEAAPDCNNPHALSAFCERRDMSRMQQQEESVDAAAMRSEANALLESLDGNAVEFARQVSQDLAHKRHQLLIWNSEGDEKEYVHIQECIREGERLLTLLRLVDVHP